MAQVVDVSMPPDLDVESGYTIRVTAVDSSGALVSNITVGTVVLTADAVAVQTTDGGNIYGDWFLVPGPGA